MKVSVSTERVSESVNQWVSEGKAGFVAQIFNLPYRGLAIRDALNRPARVKLPTPSRVQLGDTAD